jgi:ABC-type glutathione transport system ATPase component
MNPEAEIVKLQEEEEDKSENVPIDLELQTTGGITANDDEEDEQENIRIFESDPLKIELRFDQVDYSVEIPPVIETNPWARMNPLRKRTPEERAASKEKVFRQILTNVSGAAKPGQLVAIMGPSGCGKTTLLNALGGRITPQGGVVSFNGKERTKALKRVRSSF